MVTWIWTVRSLVLLAGFMSAFSATAEVNRLLVALRSGQNPSGPWEFGEKDANTGAFARFAPMSDDGSVFRWVSVNPVAGTPSVYYNHTPRSTVSSTQIVGPYSAGFHPGPAPRSTSIRYHAERKGKYTYRVEASGQDVVFTTTSVVTQRNGTPFGRLLEVTGYGPVSVRVATGVVELDAGDIVDFVVSGGASFSNDSTGIDITVVEEQANTWKPELRGIADVHSHMLANMAFGGRFIVGAPYGPLDTAMSQDADIKQHGLNHAKELVGAVMDGRYGLFLHNDGPPLYGEWPTFRDTDHNKLHIDWLKRAVDGGLRLMVMFAVDSPVLCKLVENDGRVCTNEAPVIDAQLNEARRIQAAVDQSAGGTGRGWFRIVTSPQEARDAVAQGKLAVVLGVETLNPLGTEPFSALARLRTLYNNLGVRHIFPIHQSDTWIGGASYFDCRAQREGNHAPPLPGICPDFDAIDDVAAEKVNRFDMVLEDCREYTKYGRCNTKGLAPLGKSIVKEMMRAGMIVDADHLSARSFADLIELARENGAPLVASHAGFTDVVRPSSGSSGQDHEGQLSLSRYHDLLSTGGMVGVMPASARSREDIHPVARPSGSATIPDRCGRSSETFAHSLTYALDWGDERGVAVGTDMNTPSLLMPGPRFGRWACPGGINGTPSTTRLGYPFVARGSGASLPPMNLGTRTVDFNESGLATIGQLPDLIADVEVLGLNSKELEPLFRSAETYIRVWEQVESAANTMMKRMLVFLPATLQADRPVKFKVDAVDTYRGTPVPPNADVFIDSVNVGKVRADITMTFKSVIKEGHCEYDPTRRPPRVCEPDIHIPPSPEVTIRNASGFMDSDPVVLDVR